MATNICVELAGLRNLRIHKVSRQQSGQRIPKTWRTVWREEENEDKGREDEIGSGNEKQSNHRILALLGFQRLVTLSMDSTVLSLYCL